MSPWMKWMRTTPSSSLIMYSMLSRLITLSPTRSNLLMVHHLLPPKSREGTPRSIPRPDYLSSFFGAAAAGNGLYDLGLFAGTGVLDKVPDVDDAIGADVGAIMFLSKWVRDAR